MRVLLSILAAALGLIYILNPGFGLFELLPDNLPIVGNLDEAAATALFLAGLRGLWPAKPKATAPTTGGPVGDRRRAAEQTRLPPPT